MASLPRSQHYVPEFHLAQFIGLPFRRFHVFDKKWGKFGRPPVSKSAEAMTERDGHADRAADNAAADAVASDQRETRRSLGGL